MIPPLIPDCGPETPSERVALVVWHLAHGEGLTTRQVATMLQMTAGGAWKVLSRVSRVLPIYQDSEGTWQVCFFREMDCEDVQGGTRVMVG